DSRQRWQKASGKNRESVPGRFAGLATAAKKQLKPSQPYPGTFRDLSSRAEKNDSFANRSVESRDLLFCMLWHAFGGLTRPPLIKFFSLTFRRRPTRFRICSIS